MKRRLKITIDFGEIKWAFQKLFRGYSDIELWGLTDTIYLWLYPRLKAFRRMKRHGHPANITPQEWEKFLKRSQKAIEAYCGDNEYRGFKQPLKFDWKKNDKELKEFWERIDELWD